MLSDVCAQSRQVPAMILLGFCMMLAHPGSASPASPSELLTIARALTVALQQNPDLEAARARLETAEAQVDQVRAGLLPRLSNQLQYTERESAVSAMGFGGLGGGASSIKSMIYQDMLTMQVPLYTGGRQQLQVKRARTQYRKSEIELKGARSDLIALVIEAYLNVLRACQLEKSAAERTDSLSAQRTNVEKKLQAELSTKSDLLKAEVQLESSREALLAAQNAVQTARNSLGFAMGIDDELPADLLPLTNLPFDYASEAVLLDRLEKNNPTLEAARQQVRLLQEGVRIEKAGHLPSLNLTGSYGKSARDFPPKDKNWSVAGVLDFKIFDAGQQSAKVREAHKRLAESRALLTKARQGLQVQLKNALRDYHTALERTHVSRKGLELATEELRLSNLRLEEGLVTVTDHLDNQTEYTRAQVTNIIAQFDVLLSEVRLCRLTGTLDEQFVERMEEHSGKKEHP